MSFFRQKPRSFLQQTEKELTDKFKLINSAEEQRVKRAKKLKFHETSDAFPWSFEHANQDRKIPRNRYRNAKPFDYNRVLLNSSIDDYINASKVDIGDRKYIATQGPIDETVTHFWGMVADLPDHECVIVMLTPLVEQKREKCVKYWVGESEYEVFDGVSEGFDFNMKLIGEEEREDYHGIEGLTYTKSRLEISRGKKVTKKAIHHLYYTNWGDFDKPSDWFEVFKLCLIADEIGYSKPTVVHCSAGVGRTGTFITLDYFFHNSHLLRKEGDPVFNTVMELRTQREMLVQSDAQYLFLYDTLRRYMNTQFR